MTRIGGGIYLPVPELEQLRKLVGAQKKQPQKRAAQGVLEVLSNSISDQLSQRINFCGKVGIHDAVVAERLLAPKSSEVVVQERKLELVLVLLQVPVVVALANQSPAMLQVAN